MFLWLCLYQVSGLPVAKRLSASGDGDDVLAGSDFLSVFMQRSELSRTARPIIDFNDQSFATRSKFYSRHDQDNSVVHKIPELSQYSENYEKYNKPYNTDIEYKESIMSPDVDNYKAGSEVITVTDVDVKSIQDTETTTAIEENPTTLQDVTTGHSLRDNRRKMLVSQENVSVTNEIQLTPTTTESVKVISVKISSSVVRHSHKPITSHNSENKDDVDTESNNDKTVEGRNETKRNDKHSIELKTIQEEELIDESEENDQGQEKLEAEESQQSKKTSDTQPYILAEDNLVSTLVTQDQPTITAARRDEFGVEEAPAREEPDPYRDSINPRELTNVYDYSQQKEIPGIVEEVKRVSNEGRQSKNQKLHQIGHYHNPPEALRSPLQSQPDIYAQIEPHAQTVSEGNKESLSLTGEDYSQSQSLNYQVNSQPSAPASYHASVSTATSDSKVQFYREPPNFRRGAVAETVQRNVVAKKETSSLPTSNTQRINEGNSNIAENGGRGDVRYKEKTHEEQAERSYEVPEQVYGSPEQNYEVDEAVSVVTNGRAHGLQIPTPQPTQTTPDSKEDKNKDSNHKFGYVVEGRNYRKYRVEERTPDGFIVGEYGVVSHDDGSLRGVRYTADSTINPRLIYDALVKFLSLK